MSENTQGKLSDFDVNSDLSSNVSGTSVDFFTKFNIHGGWKSLLLFQFQKQFSFTVIISVAVAYFVVLKDAVCALGTYQSWWIEKDYSHIRLHMLYAFDLIYFVDLISMTVYKKVDWTDVKYIHKPRNSFLLFIEFLTLIPLDGIYYTLSDSTNMKILYLLRLRYALRIFRLLGFYKSARNYMGVRTHILHLFIIISYVVLFVLTATTITYIFNCNPAKRICVFDNDYFFTQLALTCFNKVVMLGQEVDESISILNVYDLMFYISLIAYICNVHLISNFVCNMIELVHEKLSPIINYERIKFNVTNMLYSTTALRDIDMCMQAISTVYHLFLTRKKGIRHDDIICSYLPEIKYIELNVDMAWYALKHSHIFRNQKVSYLRYVSQHMRQVFFSPGEIIYKKKERKSKMVYIISGVVEILSEDDNETPIISFSDGTCLGETSLFIDYPCTSSVVCKVFCEASILERKNYIKTSKLYPNESRANLQAVMTRYKFARKYKTLAALQKREIHEESDELNMQWLKYILRKMLGIRSQKNDKLFLNKIEQMLCCYDYLDMLVIAKELELVTDVIFLKTTFPFIFQPHSIVLTAWKRFIFATFIYFSLFYAYNLAAVHTISNNYLVSHIVISILWYMDLYIEVSTAAKTRHFFYTTIHDIVMYKFTTLTFALNFISALNPGLLLYLMDPNITLRQFLLFEMNKMLKMYIIEIFFDSITFTSTSKLLHLNYCKFLLYLFYLLFYGSAFLHMMACFDMKCNLPYRKYLKRHGFDTPMGYILFGGYSSIKTLCNFQRHHYNRYFNLYGLFVFLTTIYLFNVISLANITACEVLTYYDTLNVNEYLRRFQVTMQAFGMHDLYRKILENITRMYQFDGIMYMYGAKIYKNVPPGLFQIVRNFTLRELIESVKIFANCDSKIISDVALRVSVSIYDKNELITVEGETHLQMLVIVHGYCVYYSKERQRILGPGFNLTAIELCMDMPVLRTMYALTHCQIMSLSAKDFKYITLKYPSLNDSIQQTRQEMLQAEAFAKIIEVKDTYKFATLFKTQKVQHFVYFDASRGAEYYKVFPKWCWPLRYIIIPCTFTPYGNFVKYWEISRSIFAMANIILLPVDIIFIKETYFWRSILVFLDLMAWIDIYARLHIIYFTNVGIEVTHPIKTAKHYILNGFLLDFISVFPIERILRLTAIHISIKKYSRCNRLLQIRRLFGLLNYFYLFNVNTLKIVHVIKYLSASLLVINLASCFAFDQFCGYSDDVSPKFECAKGSWFVLIANSTKDIVLVPERTYVYTVFLITSYFTNLYFPFVKTPLESEKYMLMILSLLGYIFWVYVTAKIITINLTKNFDLIRHQDAMRALLKFMNYRRIDKRLKNEVIAHFELIWKKAGILKINEVMSPFTLSFRKGVLFEVFGARVLRSHIFGLAGEPVIRTLLLRAKHEIILKTGIIYSVNDVLGNIFLLYKGKVEVLGADQSHLTFLGEGAIFGNLDNFPKTRQTLTMVASGHVELLVIETVAFHEILSKHPEIYRLFMRQIAVNVDYVENITDSMKVSSEIKRTKKPKKKSAARLSEEMLIIRCTKKIFICVAGISAFLEMYHIITLDHSRNCVASLYFADILYVLKVVQKFNTAYFDEFGILNRNKYMISQRYKKKGFYWDLISVLPLEVLCIVFVKQKKYMILAWSYLRANRLIRITQTMNFLINLKHKLNVNTFWVRMLNIFFNCIFLITLLCSFLYFVDSYTPSKFPAKDAKVKTFYRYWQMTMNMIMKMNIEYTRQMFDLNSAITLMPLMVMARFVALYFIASIVATAQVITRRKHLYEIFAIKIALYMENENISYPLMKLNNRYVSSLWLHYDGIQSPSLLDEAPYYLREGILNSMFGLHLRRHPVFKKCHIDLIRQISANFKVRRFFPGDIITYINDIDHCMYFIQEGVIQALSEDSLYNEVVDVTLISGNMFGFDQGIYLRAGHIYTYKVAENSLILLLKRDDWIYLLDYFPASALLLYDKHKEKELYS